MYVYISRQSPDTRAVVCRHHCRSFIETMPAKLTLSSAIFTHSAPTRPTARLEMRISLSHASNHVNVFDRPSDHAPTTTAASLRV